MGKIRTFRPTPAGLLAFVALVVAVGGVAVAAIPDSSGSIHACYLRANGQLRVVDSGDACRSSEQSLSWSGGAGGAGPRAYARVREDGSLDASHSRGVNGVVPSAVNDEAFCFDLDFAPASISVAPDGFALQAGGSLDPVQLAEWCPGGYRDAAALTQGRSGAYVILL